ncbi:MAG: hypothetical protein AB1449_07205 [Chloroflexota bacterium]
MDREALSTWVERSMHAETLWRREVRRWVYLPLLVGGLLLAAAVACVMSMGYGRASVWADISLIYLSVAATLGLLVIGTVIVGVAYGVGRLLGWLPGMADRVESFGRRASHVARRGADLSVWPVLLVRALASAVRTAIDRMASLWR